MLPLLFPRYYQNFFFQNYQIENFYELSRVKKILFKKAKESVIVAIFNNEKTENNTLNYYPVDLELFSETFNLLVIHENKRIEIKQKDILEEQVVFRDYLVGNEFDLKLINKLSDNTKLEAFLLKDIRYSSIKGMTRISNNKLKSSLDITDIEFRKFSKQKKTNFHEKFAIKNYLNKDETEYYNTAYIYQPEGKIKMFKINNVDGYMNEKDVTRKNFQRPRNTFIYKGKNIIFNRFGKRIVAAFISDDVFFSNLIYGIKLQDDNLYNLFTAILNSDLVNYFLSLKYRKRVSDNYANLDTKAIKNIPIPKELDKNLVAEISEISKHLTEGKLKYEGKTKEQLNKLIFDLYDLSYLERQRIKDFFASERTVTKNDFKQYKKTLENIFELYFVNKPYIESHQDEKFGFDIAVVAIYLNKSEAKQPTPKKALKYIISEEILKSRNENFLVMQDKIIGKDCIYIIKSTKHNNWTATKAFEDGNNILKSLKK